MVDRVDPAVTDSSTRQREDLALILRDVKECTLEVAKDIKAGQLDWMRAQTQLLGFNAWSFAWPEAVRLARSPQRDSSMPPTYDHAAAPSPLPSILERLRASNANQNMEEQTVNGSTAQPLPHNLAAVSTG
ncbi:hypothetical protein CF326_g7798 [Tilletia indica]|nr:hypothetical protein CF326_g7798 [Tilletia indica]